MSDSPSWVPPSEPGAQPPSSAPPRFGQPAPAQGGQWTPPPTWSPQQPPAWGPPPQPAANWGGSARPAAPKPGIVALRPLGVGELLDGALGLIRSNPRTVLGVAAVVSAASALIETLGLFVAARFFGAYDFALTETEVNAELNVGNVVGQGISQLVPALVTAFLQGIAAGLFIVLVAAAVLGRRLDARQTWQALRPRIWALLGLSVLVSLLGLVSLAAIVGVLVAAAPLLGAWTWALGLALGVPFALLGIYVYVRLSLASPALVIEGLSPLPALRRSWRLVAGSFWRVLGITVLASVIVNVLSSILTVPFALVGSVVGALVSGAWPVIIATGVATLAAGFITLPFSSAVTGLLYTDLRMRREALDVALISAGVEPSGDPLAPYRRR